MKCGLKCFFIFTFAPNPKIKKKPFWSFLISGRKKAICGYSNMWFVNYYHKSGKNMLFLTNFFLWCGEKTNKTKNFGPKFT